MRAARNTSGRNIRHDISPELVQAQVDKTVAQYEQYRIRFKKEAEDLLVQYEEAKADGSAARWTRIPEGPGYVDPMIDEWIARERNVYSLVRVIELPKAGKRFLLVYGDADDATVTRGTGPFESYEAASNWFLNSGR